jgi:Glycosyl hydrolases family 43
MKTWSPHHSTDAPATASGSHRPRRRTPAGAAVATALLIIGSACSPGPAATSQADAPVPTTTTRPDQTPTPPSRRPTHGRRPGAPQPDHAEPLSVGDFADPDLLLTDRGPVAFATNTLDANVPVGYFEGERFVLADALLQLPVWSEPGYVWAPSVLRVGASYVLYNTTRDRGTGQQCISGALSSTPQGPYTDRSLQPLICAHDQGGSIDPSPVKAGRQLYLLWKSDGNCCGLPTMIYTQRLDPTGLTTSGDPIELIRADQDWEGDIVEAPSMIQHDQTWYLFYSGNDWNSTQYAVGWARCDTPTGPCVKLESQPLIATDSNRAGPGGAQAIGATTTGIGLLFHAWTPNAVGYQQGGQRRLQLDTIPYQRLTAPKSQRR